MSQRTTDRRRWGWWVLGLMALVLVGAWCGDEDVREPSPRAAALDPVPVLSPAALEVAPELLDAAVTITVVGSAPLDAGPAAPARREPDVEDYMRRWKAALAPLFRSGKSTGSPKVLRPTPRETPETSDAGQGPCTAKVQRLSFNAARIDLVIVVDTSGSMSSALPEIARWLAELEQEIASRGVDVQMLVVADQRGLGRSVKPDGGSFNLGVASSDALDVLLAGAKPGAGRWVDALRSSADLHIVVVTDDEARGKSDRYLAGLTEVVGGARFSVHLLGGLDTPGHGLIASDAPLMETVCRQGKFQGQNSGLTYQRITQLTNGMRAPFCDGDARKALSTRLLDLPSPAAACGWLVDTSRHRVVGVEAVGSHHPAQRLLEERVASNCKGMRRGYRRADALLVLCEDTCTALKAEGFQALEVKLECSE